MALVSTIFSAIFFLTPVFSQTDDASYYFQKGKIEFDEAMYSYAEENLVRAVSINKEIPAAYEMLGDIRLKKKHHREALAFYQQSIAVKEAQDGVHFKIGEIEDYLADYESALSHFLRACELNHQNVYAAAGAGRILSLNGKKDEAEKYYAMSYDAGKPAEEILLRQYRAARAKKKYNDAEELLTQAIKANPADTDRYYEIVALYRSRKKIPQAVLSLEKLRYIRPEEEKTYVLLAHMYYAERQYKNRKKEIETAIAYMEKALSMNTSNTEYLEFLAELNRAAGKEDAAVRYEKLSRSSPK